MICSLTRVLYAGICRAVVVTSEGLSFQGRDGPERSSQEERPPQFLLTVPPGGIREGVPTNPVRVFQLGEQSLLAPPGR